MTTDKLPIVTEFPSDLLVKPQSPSTNSTCFYKTLCQKRDKTFSDYYRAQFSIISEERKLRDKIVSLDRQVRGDLSVISRFNSQFLKLRAQRTGNHTKFVQTVCLLDYHIALEEARHIVIPRFNLTYEEITNLIITSLNTDKNENFDIGIEVSELSRSYVKYIHLQLDWLGIFKFDCNPIYTFSSRSLERDIALRLIRLDTHRELVSTKYTSTLRDYISKE